MALTQEDLQAIGTLLEPIKADISILKVDVSSMQSDINIIKEDIELIKEYADETKGAVNSVSEWTEIASDVLLIKYSVSTKE